MKRLCPPPIKIIVFIILFLVLLEISNDLLIKKETDLPDNFTTKVMGLKNEQENSFDVMFYGNSHVFSAVNPLILFQNTGITSYVYASPGQPFPLTYHYIKESLKTQKPDVMFVEVYATTYPTEYTNETRAHQALDPIPLSWQKINMIHDAAEANNRWQYYFPIIMYHGRWHSLTAADFDFSYKKDIDFTKGYRIMKKSVEVNRCYTFLDDRIASPINEKHEDTLYKIIELAKATDTELIFFVAPFELSEKKWHLINYVKQIAHENDIKFIDFNLLAEALELDPKSDFFDSDHMNYKGAQKVTQYLSTYLQYNYKIKDKRQAEIAMEWNENYKRFLEYIDKQ